MTHSLPEDFQEFWQETEAQAHAWPLDFHRSMTNDFDLPGHVVEKFSFTSIGGRKLHGWLAYPSGARRLPAFVWVPPYGRESLLPNEFGTRPGYVSLSLNFFGHEAFHQEKYVKERGYFAEGAASPETWIFRQMYQDASIAVRILQAQIEADEDRIGTMGMSQGAGMSIWLGAWNPIVKAVCADMPFLGNIQQTLSGTVHRYPLKELTDYMEQVPLGREQAMNTVSYFDTASQASFCKVPTHVSLGLKDPAARPDQVRAIHAALPGDKELVEYDWGHDWHPEMLVRNQEWFDRHLT